MNTPSPADTGPFRHPEAPTDDNLLIQAAVGKILRIGLEPVSLEGQLQRVLDVILDLPWLGVQPRVFLFLAEDAPPELVLKVQRGLPGPLLQTCSRVPVGSCLCGQAFAGGHPRFTPCLTPEHNIRYQAIEPHGHCCVPITSAATRLGLLNLYLDPGHTPTPVQEQFLTTATDALAQMIERRRAEDRLRQSEERFALAVRGTDAGIWDWDLHTNRVYFSPRWKSMLGHDDADISPDFAEWESRLHPDDRDRAHATIRDYLEGRSADYELEHRLRHKDGSYRWILARGAAVAGPDGKPYRMVGSHLDITDRKRAEAEARHGHARILAAQKILELVLPRQPLRAPGLEVHAACAPADCAPGDYFTYFPLPDGTLLTAVADVSGHGLDAAIVTALAHTWLRSLTGRELSLDAILARLNAELMDQVDECRFMTALVLQIDPRARTLHYINAGHPAGHILGPDGAVKARLDPHRPPLAVEPDIDFPLQGPVPLQAGDHVLLLTDGVYEHAAPGQPPFGMDRVLRFVGDRVREDPARTLAALFDEVRSFGGPPLDDLTAVLVRVT